MAKEGEERPSGLTDDQQAQPDRALDELEVIGVLRDDQAPAVEVSDVQRQAWRLVLQHSGADLDLDGRIEIAEKSGDEQSIIALAGELLETEPMRALGIMEKNGLAFSPAELKTAGEKLVAAGKLLEGAELYVRADLPGEDITKLLGEILEKAKEHLFDTGDTENRVKVYKGLFVMAHGRTPTAEEWEELGDASLEKNGAMSAALYAEALDVILHTEGCGTVKWQRAVEANERQAKKVMDSDISHMPERWMDSAFVDDLMERLEKYNYVDGLRKVADFYESMGLWGKALDVRRRRVLIDAGDSEPDRAWFERAVADRRTSDADWSYLCHAGNLADELVKMGDEALSAAGQDFDSRHVFDSIGCTLERRLRGQGYERSYLGYALWCFHTAHNKPGLAKIGDFLRERRLFREAYGLYDSAEALPGDPEFYRELGKQLSKDPNALEWAAKMFQKALELEGSGEKPQAEIAK